MIVLVMLIISASLFQNSMAAPSWVDVGKYARYHGGYDTETGTPGQPGYVKIKINIDLNWTITTHTGNEVRITGGSSMSIDIFMNDSQILLGSFGTLGSENINLDSRLVTLGGGFDVFGMENLGATTILWVNSTSGLHSTSTLTAGRSCVWNTSSVNIYGFGNTVVTRFYDTETGVLLGFSFQWVTLPILVQMSSTNVYGSQGNDVLPLLVGGAIVVGIIAVATVFYLKRKRAP